MKYYLLFVLFVIMGAGARTMFEIAYQSMSTEHDFVPSREVTFLIGLTFWFILMMVFTVLLITNKKIQKRNLLVVLLSLGVFTPVVYQLLKR